MDESAKRYQLLEAQDALGHKNLVTTKVYLQGVAVKKDKFSDRIGERLGLQGGRPAEPRGRTCDLKPIAKAG